MSLQVVLQPDRPTIPNHTTLPSPPPKKRALVQLKSLFCCEWWIILHSNSGSLVQYPQQQQQKTLLATFSLRGGKCPFLWPFLSAFGQVPSFFGHSLYNCTTPGWLKKTLRYLQQPPGILALFFRSGAHRRLRAQNGSNF